MSFSFRNLRRLGNQVSVSIPTDEHGDLGRECPNPECLGYFKIRPPGTGLIGDNLPCHCPYCGHAGPTNTFFTVAQIEYAQSVAMSRVSKAIVQNLKQLEFNHRPRGAFGIGMSLAVKEGRPVPIRHYREQKLETEVVCDHCTLHYAIYGLFAFCPDCRTHNSLQILFKNLDLVLKQVALSEAQEDDGMKRYLLEDALENCVSAFDGFGRETCKVRADRSSNADKSQSVSFQNIDVAADRLRDLFGVDLRGAVPPTEWAVIRQGFMKRHVVAHRSGVVDDRYIAETGDPDAVAGRRLALALREVRELADHLQSLGQVMTSLLPNP